MTFRLRSPIALFSFGGLLLLAATFYNAGLAFLNAHGVPVGTLHVALTEIVILAIALVYLVLKIKTFPNIMPPFFFLVFMICMFLYVSFLNEHFFPKAPRDMVLVAAFFMVGGTVTQQGLFMSFRFMTVMVFLFMVVEGWMTDLYVSFFEPALYYANTRGIEQLEVDESGLFRNSLGYAGRFSFGIFNTHRLSSLFLEQVSLANFSTILAIFLSTFWGKLSKWDRILYAVTPVFIILTTSSRTASILCSLILIGHFVFPLLPRYAHMLAMPAILVTAALLFYDPNMGDTLESDDLRGRIGHTMGILAKLGTGYFTGGTLPQIFKTGDSGFAYIVMTQTVFGLLVFWLFCSVVVPPTNASNKRFDHGMAVYVFTNLLIGAAIFSIKVSAPLWIIAGYLAHERYRDKTGTAHG